MDGKGKQKVCAGSEFGRRVGCNTVNQECGMTRTVLEGYGLNFDRVGFRVPVGNPSADVRDGA